uniref:Uncharacterized protein n=1 Tax=Anopheles atroparvus TaxID=41427 RepID=A0AAG5DGB3_ANOAO
MLKTCTTINPHGDSVMHFHLNVLPSVEKKTCHALHFPRLTSTVAQPGKAW